MMVASSEAYSIALLVVVQRRSLVAAKLARSCRSQVKLVRLIDLGDTGSYTVCKWLNVALLCALLA